jgi:hypothetical protein
MSPTSCRCSTPQAYGTGRPEGPSNAARTYDRSVTPSPILLAALLVAGLLALLPVARLRAAGWPTSFVAAYWLGLVALALLLVVARAGIRVLVPLLIVGYLAPIVVLRLKGRIGTIIDRR